MTGISVAPKIPIDLLEEIERNNVLLFVGEGIHRPVANEQILPSTAELTVELAQVCGYPVGDPLTFLQVAYYCQRKLGRQKLVAFLQDRLWDHMLAPFATHYLISSLPVPSIVMTTYDDLIERTQHETKTPYVSIVRNQDVSFSDRQKRLLIWLFGRVDQPDSLILTESEQDTLLQGKSNISDILRAELAQRTWLIVGFDLNERWFRTFYEGVIKGLDSYNRNAYFCGNPPSAVVAEWCRQYHIDIDVLGSNVIACLRAIRNALANRDLPLSPEIVDPTPEYPYKGLDAFATDDRRIFFGRERETQRLTDMVRAQRLVVLYGASGTGKSSLIQAGLAPQIERSKPPYAVILVRVLGDPAQAIRTAVTQRLALDSDPPTSASLTAFLETAVQMLQRPLVLVIDQFEEFFIQCSPELRQAFNSELSSIIKQRKLQVKIVLSLREEWFVALGEMQQSIPEIYNTRCWLMPLDYEAAQEAIKKPVLPFGVHFEDALVNQLLRDLGGNGTVLPPQLQIVCGELYAGLPLGEHAITQKQYDALGAAKGILGRFLQNELLRIPTDQRVLAQRVLEELVSSHGTKIAKTHADLERALKVDAAHLQSMLQKLSGRLLCSITNKGQEPLYELAHEYLVAQIMPANETRERKKAEELITQGQDNWNRWRMLLGKDALALIEAQRKVLQPDAKALELLLRSSVAYGHAGGYWADRFLPDERNALIKCLQADLKNRDRKVQLEALALLRALRRHLPLALFVYVYSQYTMQQVPLVTRRWATQLVLISMLLAIGLWLTLPVTVGWNSVASYEQITGHARTGHLQIAVNATDPTQIFVVDQALGKLWKSVNGGITWQSINADLSAAQPIQGVAAAQQTIYVARPTGVLLSTDGGVSWQNTTDLPHHATESRAITVNPDNPAVAYMSLASSGIYATYDAGKTWVQIASQPIRDEEIRSITTNGQAIIVVTKRGIWTTPATGQPPQWKELPGPRDSDAVIEEVTTVGKHGRFFIALGQGGIRDGDISGAELLKMDDEPKGAIYSVSVAGEAWYVSSDLGLLCRRKWYATDINWWLHQMGRPVPCGA